MTELNPASTISTLTVEAALPFRDLPGEQRHSVYRYLFDNITAISQFFRVWKEEDGLPHHPQLKTYKALLLACKHVKHEASTIFEAECLPHMTFYFDRRGAAQGRPS